MVTVTGISGFLASHIAVQLLKAGYRVRGTVREASKGESVRSAIADAVPGREDDLELVSADLASDGGWDKAVSGAAAVMHCASPFPLNNPDNEDELIVPARDGALRVLRAATEAGVGRVVLTSSIAAMVGGNRDATEPIGEQHWTDIDAPGVTAYTKSKAIAERAAWEFVESTTGAPELVAINPGGIVGPVILPRLGTSNRIVEQVLSGAISAAPRVGFELVDVRDCAEAHVSAMTHKDAPGRRFPTTTGFLWLRDVGMILKKRYPDRKLPTKEMGDGVVRLAARFNESVRAVVPDLGVRVDVRSTDTMATLLWHPRPLMTTVVDTAESLLDHGLVS
jgi:nucleoside-diphosphate-sugar epimerase